MRLFAALPLSADVVAGLAAVVEEFAAHRWPVRWVPPANMHLTLRFYGSVDDSLVERVTASLARASSATGPIPLSLSGLVVFPSARKPRVLSIGVAPVPALELLQHRVETEAASLGFEPERATFRPHVTLGRVLKSARLPREAVGALAADSMALDCLAEEVILFSSRLGRGGARYTPVHTFSLGETWAA